MLDSKAAADLFIVARGRAWLLLSSGPLGSFRGSEVQALDWDHIDFEVKNEGEAGVQLFLPKSKKDQGGNGAWVWLPVAEDLQWCPVRALHALGRYSSQEESAPLFPAWQHSDKRMERATMRSRLGKWLAAAGMAAEDRALFSLHSLRRGGATEAISLGAGLRYIKTQGWWASDCVKVYLYALPDEQLKQAAGLLRNGRNNGQNGQRALPLMPRSWMRRRASSSAGGRLSPRLKWRRDGKQLGSTSRLLWQPRYAVLCVRHPGR